MDVSSLTGAVQLSKVVVTMSLSDDPPAFLTKDCGEFFGIRTRPEELLRESLSVMELQLQFVEQQETDMETEMKMKITEIKEQKKILKRKITEYKQWTSPQPKILTPTLPLKSAGEVFVFENYLDANEEYKKQVEILRHKDKDASVHRVTVSILEKLMTLDSASQFNWTGKQQKTTKRKYPIRNMKITRLIMG